MEATKRAKWSNFLSIYPIGTHMNKIHGFFSKTSKKYSRHVKHIDVYKTCVVLNWNVLI